MVIVIRLERDRSRCYSGSSYCSSCIYPLVPPPTRSADPKPPIAEPACSKNESANGGTPIFGDWWRS